MVEIPNNYKGFKIIPSNDAKLESFYEDLSVNTYELLENQYLAITDESGTVVDRYKWQDGRYKPIFKKPVESSAVGRVKPKNVEQAFAIDMLMDNSTTVKIMTGSFGSGKTFLSCACSFHLLQNGPFEKLMWIRNNIEVKDSNPIGFLKGTFNDKMSVWAMPLADHIGGKFMLDRYMQNGQIEVEHLGFLRGRDIKNTIIFCSEAEHLTREHVQLLLGRVAEGSILILEGDVRQIDARAFEKDNGLIAAIDKLKGNRLCSYVHLDESVRSETAKLADLLNK